MDTPCSHSPPITADQIRAVIGQFLHERHQAKLDKVKADDLDERTRLEGVFQPGTWIADAAQRVGQIQQVTHALKFSHPDAKGSSLSSRGNTQARAHEIGSHSLTGEPEPDVVGNAAALDVYKFLRRPVGAGTLLDLCIQGDAALREALTAYGATLEQAESWMAAFASLPEANGEPSSHKLAKQLYWPLPEGGYHLLAPLFPTSLVHQLWRGLREDRFSDQARAAREARYKQQPHPHGYREYPDLAIQNFGGTKPQNISQLNSERYGENWLLASLPPDWQSTELHAPLQERTIYVRLGKQKVVRDTIRELRDHLYHAGLRNNLEIRQIRARLVDELCDQLLQLAAALQSLPAGWSRDSQLNIAEQCWLDPGRAALDESFGATRRRGDWLDSVTQGFGNWLNARLETRSRHLGEAEASAWQDVLTERLNEIRWELSHE